MGVRADQGRLRAGVAAYLAWLGELEARWVAADLSPQSFAALVSEGREAEVEAYLDESGQ